MPDAPTTSDDADRVVLRVPADARYARVVRVAVSAFAVRLRLPPAVVEDLRLAVDEALVLLLGREIETVGATVVVTLAATDGRPPVGVELALEPPATATVSDPSALARFTELIPAGVTVDAVDADAGLVRLRHPG